MKSNYFEFRSGYAYEHALRLQGLLGVEGYTGLLAFEPEETITFGRAADEASDLLVSPSFLNDRGITLLSTDRGGKATWHGPGQLVGFPILNLKTLYGDARAVKRFTEELLLGLAHACAVLGVRSVETRSDFPGLWTTRGKLASIGITVKDGQIFHGFSLNVRQSTLAGFGLIHPCGIENCPITSLEQEGVNVESIEALSKQILPYLSVVSGGEISKNARTVNHDVSMTNLVSAVSRSAMAIDHFRSNMERRH